MAPPDKKMGTGLRGIIAGETALCTVGKTGTGLTYCGYDIADLAANARFEEISWLLTHGELPTQAELDDYVARLKSLRGLPAAMKDTLERIPASAHPMDVMRTGCSMLGNLEPESNFNEQQDKIERMLAVFPSIICYWYRYSHDGVRIDADDSDVDSIGGQFLHMLHDDQPTALHEQVMNSSLILYAEHEFNASTFTARVCASTLSDIFSCVTGAIGTLRGPLHGGANEAAMAMLEQWQTADEAEQAILGMLTRKEKIMGFGHAVYRESDPRNGIIKEWARKLAADIGDAVLMPVSERRFLSCCCLPFHGDPDKAVHADLRHVARGRLDRPYHGAACQQPDHPAQRRLYRTRAAHPGPDRRTVTANVDINERPPRTVC